VPDGFSFMVLGRPQGKGRPRHGQGRTWTPRETTLAEQGIRAGWTSAGAVRLEGAITLHVLLSVTRPKSHYKTNGALSAEGVRHPQPRNKKPDVDNALKLVMDALNTRAWHDDVQIVQAQVDRVWDDREYTRVIARAVDVMTVERAA
jgi:Holliday junction resolvase RusA-like endonuclease